MGSRVALGAGVAVDTAVGMLAAVGVQLVRTQERQNRTTSQDLTFMVPHFLSYLLNLGCKSPA